MIPTFFLLFHQKPLVSLKKVFLWCITEPEWEFMKKLEDVEAAEREKAFFECDVSDPDAEVTWERDGKV